MTGASGRPVARTIRSLRWYSGALLVRNNEATRRGIVSEI
jgi:hypothetical protein